LERMSGPKWVQEKARETDPMKVLGKVQGMAQTTGQPKGLEMGLVKVLLKVRGMVLVKGQETVGLKALRMGQVMVQAMVQGMVQGKDRGLGLATVRGKDRD